MIFIGVNETMSYKEEQGLDSQFNAEEIEKRCDAYWSANEVYKYDATQSRDNSFVIDTPPPTVSGSLHIGHIFSYTQTDIIARYQRMQGKSVFYPIGWDDNGLPTERRVQNYYNIACNPKVAYNPNFKPVHIENSKDERKEISRKNFIEACETLTAEDEKIFENVFRRIGHSYDWNLTYSTISPTSIKISQASFLDLYKKGKVVAVEAPIMWDVTFKSAVSQAEVEDKEMEGYFHDIRFSVKDSDETFTIATTRPEFLAACLAIVAHPDDSLHAHHIAFGDVRAPDEAPPRPHVLAYKRQLVCVHTVVLQVRACDLPQRSVARVGHVHGVAVIVQVVESEVRAGQVLEDDPAVVRRIAGHEEIQPLLVCFDVYELVDDLLVVVQNACREDALM